MLIGREEELAAVDRALDRLSARAAGALLVVGEAGIGKTSLVGELIGRAHAREARVVAARAAEFERDVPFALLSALLEEALVDAPPRLAAELGPGRVDELALVAPSLADRRAPAGGAEPPSLPAERFRLHRAVRALLEAVGAGRRLALVADDVHWADEASQEALLALLHRPPRGVHVLVLATRPGPVALRFTEALRSRPDAERLELRPLAPDDAARLVGPRLSRRERAGVLEAAGGNPFYLQELSRTAHAPVPAAVPAAAAAGGIPAAVLAAVQTEVAALHPEARTLLRGAAVAGDPFDVDFAMAAAGMTAVGAMDELLAADLVRPDGRPRQLRFRHPIVRAAVLETAGAAFRRAAHERAAAALAAAGAPAAAQAAHVEQVATQGDAAAVDLLARAAGEAAGRAPAVAAHWYTAALRLADPADVARRLVLLRALAQAQQATGRFHEADAALTEALALAPPVPDPAALALVEERAAVQHRLGRRLAAAQALEAALERTDPASPEAAGPAIVRAWQCFYTGDGAGMARWAARAGAAAAASGQPELTAAVRALAGVAACWEGDPAAGEAALLEAAALVESMPDAALARRPAVAFYAGIGLLVPLRFREAARVARRGVAAARTTGDEANLGVMLQLQGTAELHLGELDAAEVAAERATDVARAGGHRSDVWDGLWLEAYIALVRGRLEVAVAHADELERLRAELSSEVAGPVGHLVLALVRAAAGDAERGVRELEAGGFPELPAVGAAGRPWHLAMAMPVYLDAGRVGDARAAAVLARTGGGTGTDTWGLACEAELALAEGRDATAAADAALATPAAAVPLYGMQLRLLAGRAHAAAGDRDGAVELLEQAARDAAAAGLGRAVEEAARELRRLGRRLPARTAVAAAGDAGALTDREREIAELAAAGRTNKEIARTVFLSEKTVEGHLSRVFAKLGVRSRVALAAALGAGDGADRG